MRLLIVDDEVSAIQAVQQGVRWSRLSFEQVYTATSKHEAIELISKERIDILLCDIEMPMGSGLELLEWVNEHAPDVRCIFMTCHADFHFAQSAVRLGSLDYILKPLNFEVLELALANAVRLWREARYLRENSISWLDNKDTLRKQFWKDLFMGEIEPSEISIKEYLEQKHLSVPLEDTYMPILVSVKHWPPHIVKDDHRLFQFALLNMAQEIFDVPDTHVEISPFSSDTMLLMLSRKPGTTDDLLSTVQMCCETMVSVVQEYIEMVISCYIGEPDVIYGIPNQLEVLQTMDFNNVVLSRNILLYRQYTRSTLTYQNHDFIEWESLLEQNYFDETAEQIRRFLESVNHLHQMNREFLHYFYRDFYFLLFSFTRKHHVFLDELFADKTSERISQEGTSSLEGLLQWVDYALEKLRSFVKESVGGDPVEKTKRYINDHLSEELAMETLAKNVHLNGDYLTRLFKKQLDISISHYIIKCRMRRAKWLLEHTSSSIGDVAAQVGYYNYSSFNRIFTKVFGMSPQEYKNSVKKGTSAPTP